MIYNYGFELDKRSRFQYSMTESLKEEIAKTSLKRARLFYQEMGRFLGIT